MTPTKGQSAVQATYVKLSPAQRAQLEAEASRLGLSLSDVIRMAVLAHLKEGGAEALAREIAAARVESVESHVEDGLARYLAGLPEQLQVKIAEYAAGLEKLYEGLDLTDGPPEVPLAVGRVKNIFVRPGAQDTPSKRARRTGVKHKATKENGR